MLLALDATRHNTARKAVTSLEEKEMSVVIGTGDQVYRG
jgi:hypothetical protein